MQYAHITEFCQFDLNEHIVRCRFTEMGVTESYCNSVESSSIFILVIPPPRICLLRKNYWTDLHRIYIYFFFSIFFILYAICIYYRILPI